MGVIMHFEILQRPLYKLLRNRRLAISRPNWTSIALENWFYLVKLSDDWFAINDDLYEWLSYYVSDDSCQIDLTTYPVIPQSKRSMLTFRFRDSSIAVLFKLTWITDSI